MGGQARPGGGGGDRGSIGILRWRLADDERAGKIPHKVAPGLPPGMSSMGAGLTPASYGSR